MPFVIFGQGGHAASVAAATYLMSNTITISTDEVSKVKRKKCILGFGDLRKRREFFTCHHELNWTSIYHPNAVVSKNAQIGRGVFIGAGAFIGARAKIGDHCIINTHAIVEHDCEVSENTHIAVGAVLCGGCKVGEDTFIGAQATLIPKVKVGCQTFIAAHTKVQNNIPDQYFHDQTTTTIRKSYSLEEIKWCAKKPLKFDNISKYLENSISQNHFTNNGPGVLELEMYLQNFLMTEKKVHMASSGTAALHALVAAFNIRENKVLTFATQAFTFPSSILGPLKNSIVVDNDVKFLGPAIFELEKYKNEIDGVIVTNVFGLVVDVKKYVTWCKKNSKILIFDNAATPMAFMNEQNVCDLGDASILSFHETKFFGRGEGGAIVCDENLYSYVNRAINFGFNFGDTVRKYHIEASNWRMSDFSAAFLRDYLQNISIFVGQFENNCIEIKKMIAESSFEFLFNFPDSTIFSSICLRAPREITTKEICNLSKKHNIEMKKYYVPLGDEDRVPFAYEMYNYAICLPYHYEITLIQVRHMLKILEDYFS